MDAVFNVWHVVLVLLGKGNEMNDKVNGNGVKAETFADVLIQLGEHGLFVSFGEGRYTLTEMGQRIINDALTVPEVLAYHDRLIGEGVPRQIVRLAILLSGAAQAYAGKTLAEIGD